MFPIFSFALPLVNRVVINRGAQVDILSAGKSGGRSSSLHDAAEHRWSQSCKMSRIYPCKKLASWGKMFGRPK